MHFKAFLTIFGTKFIKYEKKLFCFRNSHILCIIPQKCIIRPPNAKIGFLCLNFGPFGQLQIYETQKDPSLRFSALTFQNYHGLIVLRPLTDLWKHFFYAEFTQGHCVNI